MKSVLVHAILALGGLSLAYHVWTEGEQPERPQDEVVVFECDADDLEWIHYRGERRDVRLESRDIDGKSAYWITSKSLTPKGERPPKGGLPEPKSFAGNETVKEYLEQVAPFRALRALGVVKGKQLDALELKKPKASIEVRCDGQTRRFDVGGNAYGTGDRYFRAKGGSAYLVAARVVDDLDSAEFRLMQRDLHRFKNEEVQTLRVAAQGKELKLLQRNRLQPEKAEWVNAAEPARRNEVYGNWLKKVIGLRATEYLPRGKNPGSHTKGTNLPSVPVVTLEYMDEDGDRIGKTEIVRVDSQPAEYFARTEATHAWVKIPASLATQVEDDGRSMLGLDPIARPAPEQPEEAMSSEMPDGGAPQGSQGESGGPTRGRGVDAGVPEGPTKRGRVDAGAGNPARRVRDAAAGGETATQRPAKAPAKAPAKTAPTKAPTKTAPEKAP